MSENHLIYLGLTRESASLTLRERVVASMEPLSDVYRELRAFAPERLLLSTCERFEIYGYGQRAAIDGLLGWLGSVCGVGVEALARNARVLTGLPVGEHLLRVSSGLESRVAGETQILTQIRHAYRVCERQGGAGPILHCLARSAIHTGRRVCREQAVNQANRSVATVAIEYLSSAIPRKVAPLASPLTKGGSRGVLQRFQNLPQPLLGKEGGRNRHNLSGSGTGRFASLTDKSILVIGTGRLASDVCRELAGHRLRRLVIASHSESRAASFARPLGGFGVALSGMDEAIRGCDAVIACSNVVSPVLGLGHVGRRSGRELCILDLGMPRNVDAKVGRVPGVRLERLGAMLDREHAGHEFPEADRIVLEELNRFARWFTGRSVAPSIARLVELRRDRCFGSTGEAGRALHREIMRIKAGVAA